MMSMDKIKEFLNSLFDDGISSAKIKKLHKILCDLQEYSDGLERFCPNNTTYEIVLNKDGELESISFYGNYVDYVISDGKIQYAYDDYPNTGNHWKTLLRFK